MGERLLWCQTLAPLELGKSPLNLFVDGPFVLLKPAFLSIERFQSLVDETKLLSLSFWRDEAAVAAWRNTEHHRSAQKAGRHGVLRDYRLRVAHVLRDYGMNARAEAPADSRRSNG